MRLDARSSFPSGMERYLEFYGWHFSKKMEEWASKQMVKDDKQAISPYSKEELENMFSSYGISIQGGVTYDALYIANMCKADFLGSAIVDDMHLLLYVKNVIEDPDGYDGLPFTRFYADCIGSGKPIQWEDML